MIGRTDGENAIKAGEGYFFQKMRDWENSTELQAEFPEIGAYIHHEN